MTIREAAQYCREQLKTIYQSGEAETMSDWLIEHLTGMKRTSRSSQENKVLEPATESTLKEMMGRLLNHEPLQYVVEESWFNGLKFYVDRNVLIPRPETEELVEWIISDCKFPLQPMRILDIGTGSGCIAISLKKRLGKAEIQACDISKNALAVAQRNALTLGLTVKFLELDFLDRKAVSGLPAFDVIVSNPPYIPETDKAAMNPNVVEFEPATALFVPDNDPYIFYKALADAGKTHLATGGTIYAEIHEDLGNGLISLFKEAGYAIELKKDMQGKDRMLKAKVLV